MSFARGERQRCIKSARERFDDTTNRQTQWSQKHKHDGVKEIPVFGEAGGYIVFFFFPSKDRRKALKRFVPPIFQYGHKRNVLRCVTPPYVSTRDATGVSPPRGYQQRYNNIK